MQFQGEAPGVTEAHGIHDKSSPSRCMEGHGIPDVIPDESNLTQCMDPGDTRGPIGQTFQDQLEEIDAELAKSDHQDLNSINHVDSNSCAPKCPLAQAQNNEACDPHDSARAPTPKVVKPGPDRTVRP